MLPGKTSTGWRCTRKREALSESQDAGNLLVRFDERDVETEPWWNH